MRWQFRGKAPASIKVVLALLIINFIGQFVAAIGIPRWSPTQPDAIHSYMIRFKGGAMYFVQPWPGKYFDHGFWVGIALLGLMSLMVWIHRDQLERVS